MIQILKIIVIGIGYATMGLIGAGLGVVIGYATM
jgi:hypothetical protein